MTANSQLLTTTPKNKNKSKLTKQTTRTGKNHRNGDHMEGLSTGEWEGERGRKGTENK